jgi:two-component system nitrogen regulation sensor histidine kinase GlnL
VQEGQQTPVLHYIGAMTAAPPSPSLEVLGTPVAWADAEGRVAGCNPAFARWLGVSVRRLLGQPLASLEVQGEALAHFLARGERDTLRGGPALRRGLAERL